MRELADILKDLPEQGTYMSDYHWETVEGKNRVKARGTPGPVATRVLNFLRTH
jgi:hypothetical protein